MTAAAIQAVDVRPPTDGLIYTYATSTTHGVELVPAPLINSFSTWQMDGFKGYLVFGAVPTIEATSALTASVITAADTDAIKLSIATRTDAIVYSGADLGGTVGAALFTSPTLVSVTGNGNAHINATDVVFTCQQWRRDGSTGPQITVTVHVTNDLNGTVYGVDARDAQNNATHPYIVKVLSIEVPAQGGTSGAFEFGLYERVAAAVNGCIPMPDGVPVPFRIPKETPFFSHEAAGSGKLIAWASSP